MQSLADIKTENDTDLSLFDKAVAFIRSIGIPVHFRNLDSPDFLPGICIVAGEITVDIEKLKYPGDILHEAGHIAVVPAAERNLLDAGAISARPMREAEELMVIAWTYAACVYLQIDAGFVFHNDGYQKGGSNIVENFRNGHYFGVPMLQWTGMALEKQNPNEPETPVYPAMLKWLRD